jgi:hypothetical protein
MKKIPLNIIGTSAKVSSKKYCDKLDCDTKPFWSKLCFLGSHSMLPLLCSSFFPHFRGLLQPLKLHDRSKSSIHPFLLKRHSNPSDRLAVSVS